MPLIQIRRTGAILVSAALLASLAATTAVAPTLAAKPKCMGQTATIVGTKKADVIRGTAKRDVIVGKAGNDIIIGKAGNDIICGNAGNDRLVGKAGADRASGGAGKDRIFGGPGPDRLFGGPGPDLVAGQPGNDVLDGGIGLDTCHQGQGAGPRVRCELPVPHTLLPIGPEVLAIAYSDIDGLDGYSTGDVLIAKLVDVDGNGADPGDTIVMGMFPTTANPTKAADFVGLGDASHSVTSVPVDMSDFMNIQTDAGVHEFTEGDASDPDSYWENAAGPQSLIEDHRSGQVDKVSRNKNSPSQPAQAGSSSLDNPGDDGLIDVEVY